MPCENVARRRIWCYAGRPDRTLNRVGRVRIRFTEPQGEVSQEVLVSGGRLVQTGRRRPRGGLCRDRQFRSRPAEEQAAEYGVGPSRVREAEGHVSGHVPDEVLTVDESRGGLR